jgi:hypothetical protein
MQFPDPNTATYYVADDGTLYKYRKKWTKTKYNKYDNPLEFYTEGISWNVSEKYSSIRTYLYSGDISDPIKFKKSDLDTKVYNGKLKIALTNYGSARKIEKNKEKRELIPQTDVYFEITNPTLGELLKTLSKIFQRKATKEEKEYAKSLYFKEPPNKVWKFYDVYGSHLYFEGPIYKLKNGLYAFGLGS